MTIHRLYRSRLPIPVALFAIASLPALQAQDSPETESSEASPAADTTGEAPSEAGSETASGTEASESTPGAASGAQETTLAANTRSPVVIDDEAPRAVGDLATTVIESDPRPARPRRVADTPVIVNQTTEVATRTEAEISEVPVTVGIIGENEILRTAPLSFDRLIWTEPNVDTLGGPRYLGEQVTIRGEGGNAVTVRIDDARQNFVSGHTGQRFFVEPDFLREVEILRGAGSFLYGSGSAGVINLSTLDPVDVLNDGGNFGLRIRNQYHDNSDEWGHSVVGAVAGDGIEVLLATSQRDGDNITLPDGVELPNSAIERDSNMAKMVLTPNSEHRVELNFMDYHSLDQGGANPQGGLSITNDFVGREMDYQQFTANYQYQPIDNDLIGIDATFYYNETTQVRSYDGVFVTANAGRVNRHSLDVMGVDFTNHSEIQIGNREHEIVFGIDYFTETQDGEETRATFFVPGAPGNAGGRPDAEADHFAVFLTDEVDLTEQFTLFAGVRFDTYETRQTAGGNLSQSDSALSPNIGFDYDINKNLSLVGRYSKAFTEPTLNDLYQSGSHFGIVANEPFFVPQPPPVFFGPNYYEEVFVPNPNLMPETSDNFELAVHYEDEDFHGGRVVSRLTGFYKQGEDTFDSEIVGTATTFPYTGFIPFTPGSLTQDFRQTVNRAETEIYGAEFTFDYDADVWFASLAAGMVRGKDTSTGRNLNNIPGDQISLTTGVRPTEKVEFGVYGIWNDGRFDRVNRINNPNEATGGYDIYGLFASWAPVENWTLRFGVDNLFDTAYERTSLLQPEPGRNIFFSSTLYW